jgi:hypothetical protein
MQVNLLPPGSFGEHELKRLIEQPEGLLVAAIEGYADTPSRPSIALDAGIELFRWADLSRGDGQHDAEASVGRPM